MDRPESLGVPAAPNASRVRGRLVSIRPGPEGQGAIWEIAVAESEDVDNLPNFGRVQIGRTISVYVHPGSSHALAENDAVEARVAFQGDERGGAFFLIEDDARRL